MYTLFSRCRKFYQRKASSIQKAYKEINYIYALSGSSFEIDRLKNWLYNIFQNQDQVNYFMKDIMPAHINIYFDNQNSDKTHRILSNRIIKECK